MRCRSYLLALLMLILAGCSGGGSSAGGGASAGPGPATTGLALTVRLAPSPRVLARNGSPDVVRVEVYDLLTHTLITQGQADVPEGASQVSVFVGSVPPGRFLVVAKGVDLNGTVLLSSGETEVTVVAGSTTSLTLILSSLNLTPSLRFSAQPLNAVAGAHLAPVRVEVLDAAGSLDPAAAVPVSLTLNGTPGTLGGTLTVTSLAGVAEFSDLTVSQPGTYTLTASAPGYTSVNSLSFLIAATVGPPAQLAFATPPGNVSAFDTMLPVVVAIQDSNGVLVPTATNAVTLALAANPGPSTLSGTLTVNAVGGLATFSDLSLDVVGTGYTLMASSPGLTSLTSGAFDVTPALGSLTLVGVVPVGDSPNFPAMTNDGRFLYVPLFNDNQVRAYSVDAGSGGLTELTNSPFGGFSKPAAAAITPDDGSLFITNAMSAVLTTFSVNSSNGDLTATGSAATGSNPLRGEVTPDGSFFYVTNFFSHTLSGYNVLPGSLLSELASSPETASGFGPDSLTISPDGLFLYTSNGNVYSINSGNGDLTELLASPFVDAVGEPELDAGGNLLFVFDSASGTFRSLLRNPTTGVPTLADSFSLGSASLGTPAVEHSNQFVYFSDSGGALIYGFSFDSSGNLTPVPGSPFASGGGPGTQPTFIIAHPGADFLYVFNRVTNDISIFAISNTSGA